MPTTVTREIRPSGGDYTSLSAFESNEQRDLVALDEISVALCFTFAGGLDDTVEVDGWTMDADHYLELTVNEADRHNGTPKSGFYIETNPGNAQIISTSTGGSDWHGFVRWFDMENLSTGGVARCMQLRSLGANDIEVEQCLGKTAGGGGGGNATAYGARAVSFIARNCIAYERPAAGGAFGTGGFGAFPDCFNCTSVDNEIGFDGQGSGSLVKNCVSAFNTTNYQGTFDTTNSTHNATSSGTDDAPGGNSVTGIVDGDFTDRANDDYSLAAGSALIDVGTDLSADGVTIDIIGTSRPQGSVYDIGAFERVAAAAAASLVIPPRLRGAAYLRM